MRNSFARAMQIHPMIIFWLGLLTGALIVGFVFFYRAVNPGDYESAVLRNLRLNTRSTTQVAPTTQLSQDTSLYSYPTPTGDLQAYPTPTGDLLAYPTPTGD